MVPAAAAVVGERTLVSRYSIPFFPADPIEKHLGRPWPAELPGELPAVEFLTDVKPLRWS